MSFTKQSLLSSSENFQPICQKCAFVKTCGQPTSVHLEQSSGACGACHCLNFPQ